jgi:hypothetical protein
MLPYIVAYSLLLASALWGNRRRLSPSIWLAIGMIPAAALVAFRGKTGTDTAAYLDITTRIVLQNGEGIPVTLEPGFVLLVRVIHLFVDSPQAIVNIISAITSILLWFAFSRKKEDALVFVLLIFPYFFFDMSMNGMRYGLAFALAKTASDQLDSGRKDRFLGLFCVSISIHISAVIVGGLLQLNRLRNLRYVFGFVSLLAVVFVVSASALESKLANYLVYQPAHELAGTAPLFIAIVATTAAIYFQRDRRQVFLILMLLMAISFGITQVTYAGMRLEQLVMFAIFCQYARFEFPVRQKRHIFVFVMTLIAVLCFGARSRNMIDEAGVGPSPFIPYKPYWHNSAQG